MCYRKSSKLLQLDDIRAQEVKTSDLEEGLKVMFCISLLLHPGLFLLQQYS